MPSELVVLANAAESLRTIGAVRSLEGGLDLRLGVDALRETRNAAAAERPP